MSTCNSYKYTVIVMIVSISFLILFGNLCVTPYIITSAYSSAQCTAVSVTFHGYTKCSCYVDDHSTPLGCGSHYPCQEITVTFTTTQSLETHRSRLLHNYVADFKKAKCSMWLCDQSLENNKRLVSEFVASYGNTDGNSTYTCFYNPENPDEVIVEKASLTSVIFIMVLPSFVFLCCVIVLLVSYCQHSPDGYFGMFRRSGNNYVA